MKLALLFLLAAPRQTADLRWKLDGDALEAGGSGRDGTLQGRCEFVESPIGVEGKLLSLNGVDASLRLEGLTGFGADWGFSVWLLPLDLKAGAIASRGWLLDSAPDGTVRLEAPGEKPLVLASERGRLTAGQWHHVGLAVRAGAATLYVNGDSAATAAAPGARWGDAAHPLLVGKTKPEGRPFCGLIDDLRLHAKPPTPEDIARLVREGLPWARPGAHVREPFRDRFELREHDVVAFVGGENVWAAQETGHLETLLTLHAGKTPVHFRNLAWEGDTVYEQWRILNFGSWERQFERSGATVLIAQFGQTEALEGKAALPRFLEAYEKLFDRFAARTRRVVVLSPLPYERAGPDLPDLTARNGDLGLYVDGIRGLAAKKSALFVDLFAPLLKVERPRTRDGLHLTESGHRDAAQETAAQLGLTLRTLDDRREDLRKAIREKNRLWVEHWRPTNWAFLNGDRTEQPSSRDHRDHRVRWFPVEVQTGLALVRRQEARIAELSR